MRTQKIFPYLSVNSEYLPTQSISVDLVCLMLRIQFFNVYLIRII